MNFKKIFIKQFYFIFTSYFVFNELFNKKLFSYLKIVINFRFYQSVFTPKNSILGLSLLLSNF